ncbi:MAG: peptidase [Caulobacter sp.]|nr:peptidase [Caulobacter sp.]
MHSQSLAAPSSHARGLFCLAVGMIVSVAALNATAGLTAIGPIPASTPVAAPTAAPGLVSVPTPAVPVQTLAPPAPAFVFDAPLPGRQINSPFGLRQLPWEENGRLHEGVDIAAPEGAPVRAATDGVVVRTGVSGTYGRFVELAHKDGLHSFYAHLGRPLAGLASGAQVARGDTIAFVGDSGRSTGAHLHFELRRDGKPLNPGLFLGRSFAQADDLPLKAAARVGSKVRLATVSRWPKGVLAARAEKRAGKGPRATPAEAGSIQLAEATTVPAGQGGRVRARLQWLARPEAPAAAGASAPIQIAPASPS